MQSHKNTSKGEDDKSSMQILTTVQTTKSKQIARYFATKEPRKQEGN